MNSLGIWDFAIGAPLIGAGFSFGFVVVRWLANFIAGRLDKREDRIDAHIAKLIDGLKERIDSLTQSEGELRRELAANREEFRAYQRETDEQLRECRKKHAESEAEVTQLRAMLAGFGDARQHAALIVASEKKDAKG